MCRKFDLTGLEDARASRESQCHLLACLRRRARAFLLQPCTAAPLLHPNAHEPAACAARPILSCRPTALSGASCGPRPRVGSAPAAAAARPLPARCVATAAPETRHTGRPACSGTASTARRGASGSGALAACASLTRRRVSAASPVRAASAPTCASSSTSVEAGRSGHPLPAEQGLCCGLCHDAHGEHQCSQLPCRWSLQARRLGYVYVRQDGRTETSKPAGESEAGKRASCRRE